MVQPSSHGSPVFSGSSYQSMILVWNGGNFTSIVPDDPPKNLLCSMHITVIRGHSGAFHRWLVKHILNGGIIYG